MSSLGGGVVRVGTDRFHVPIRRREVTVSLVLVAVIVTLAILGLRLGDFPLTTGEVVDALRGQPGPAHLVVVEWRWPRVVAAVVIGAALAVAGAVFQSMTRNPLASPDLIGLSAGSFTGMLIALVVLQANWAAQALGALIGGVATAAVIYLLAYRDGFAGFRLIIVGIGVTSMLAAFNTWLLLRIDVETAIVATAWGIGSLAGAFGAVVWPTVGCLIVLLALIPFWWPAVGQLELGDDVAASTGVSLSRDRLIVVTLAVALVAVSTTVAGPVAFVALAAPQVARRLVGSPHPPLVATMGIGAALLLAADLIAQHALPLTVPVGAVTVVIGGGYLLWLVLREVDLR